MPTLNTKPFLCTALSLGALALGGLHTPAQAAPAAAANGTLLSLDDIERRASAQGVQVKELELRDALVEVKGRNTEAQKVELLIDRRSGEVLSHEVKPAKGRETDHKRD